MTTHPGFALTAAAVTTTILLARWWASPRTRRWHGSALRLLRRLSVPAPLRPRQALDPSARRVVREAEQHLSQQWNRLHSFYPHLSEDSSPRR